LHTVDRAICSDCKPTQVVVAAFATVDRKGVVALAGGQQVARAVRAIVDTQSFHIIGKVAAAQFLHLVEQDACVAAAGFCLVFPDADVFLPDVKESGFLIHHHTFELGVGVGRCSGGNGHGELSDSLGADRAVAAIDQLELSHIPRLAAGDENVVFSADRTAVER